MLCFFIWAKRVWNNLSQPDMITQSRLDYGIDQSLVVELPKAEEKRLSYSAEYPPRTEKRALDKFGLNRVRDVGTFTSGGSHRALPTRMPSI